LEDHGARVPDQDCLEYGRIADIGNRNDLTNAYFTRLVGTVSDVRILLLVWRVGVKARLFFYHRRRSYGLLIGGKPWMFSFILVPSPIVFILVNLIE